MKKAKLFLMMATLALSEKLNSYEKKAVVKSVKFERSEPVKPKGLKEFKFCGTSVWALNEKNAKRKAQKLGLI